MYHGSPRYFNTFVDGLCAEDSGRSDLVIDFSGLVENECQDVFVVADGDDTLEYQLSVASDYCTSGTVVGVLEP